MPRRRLIPLSERAAWTAALSGIPHAFGHTWESCAAMEQTSKMATFLYCFEDGETRVVCPFAERTWGGHVDIVTPYGFSGFAGTGRHSGVAADWQDMAKGRAYVCGYIAMNPLFCDTSYGDPADAFYHNSLFLLDLTRTESELFAALSTNRKREVRAAEKAGWVPVERSPEIGLFLRERWVSFLESRRAGQAFAFSDDTLASLSALESVLFLAAGGAERIEAVAAFAWTPYCAEYLLGISAPGAERYSGRLLWHGALRLKSMGIPVLNLGGGIRPGDGVARFKMRFGGKESPFGALKQVYLADTYAALCHEAGLPPNDRSGYFPPYRSNHLPKPTP